jgi:DNA-binding Lrp family transcriptional regulator
MERVLVDDTDRRIIHALTIEPRASFRTLAQVSGVADQTAARRYRRLQEVAGLRVLGRIEGARVGWVDWFLRLQAVPGAAASVADALARRPDTRWVQLASGGTEIILAMQARTAEQRDALFLRGLPGSRRITQISAHALLHIFSAPTWSYPVSGLLSEAEIVKLAVARPPSDDGTITLSTADEALLATLAEDGRASNAHIATAIGWHESTVRRRIDELRRRGVLQFDIDLDTHALGMSTQAMLWISVEPAQLEETGRVIAHHPEVPFVAATTGATNLVANVVCEDGRHLYSYLTDRLAGLSGVRAVETAPVIRTLKRSGRLS